MNDHQTTPDRKNFVRVALALIVRHPVTGPARVPGIFRTSEVLLTLRRRGTVYGGWWEFPGGKIDPDETPRQAIIREVREEIGCEIEVIGHLPVHRHAYAHAEVRLEPFLCRLEKGEPRNIEVAAHRWATIESLPVPGFLPGNLELIEDLRQFAAGQPPAS